MLTVTGCDVIVTLTKLFTCRLCVFDWVWVPKAHSCTPASVRPSIRSVRSVF